MKNPVQVLLHEANPVLRSRAHTDLGKQAMNRKNLDEAREHWEEASDLDPTDEVPRSLLAALPKPKSARRRWWLW